MSNSTVEEWDVDVDFPIKPSYPVSVDIETWGTRPASIPIAIGAVKFDPVAHVYIDKFYQAIDPKSAHVLGLQMDVETILWWMDPKQRGALDHWLAQPKVSLSEALDGFEQWYGPESLPTWTKGPAFDSVILDTAYKVTGLRKPWEYRHDRDFRSIRGLVPKDWIPPVGPALLMHDALADAEWQTYQLLAIARDLGLTLS